MTNRYPRQDGYIGIAKQSSKGTASSPEHYIKWSGSTSMTPEMDFTQYNEGGDGHYAGLMLKEMHRPDGSFECFARPTITGFLFALLLGDESVEGTEAPYEHTITPEEDEELPWATIERAISDQLVTRFVDVRIQSIEVSGEAGQPISLTVNYLGIGEDKEDTPESSVTFEDNDPFIFWHGTYTVDDEELDCQISAFNITVENVYDDNDQTCEQGRADIPLIRRTVTASWTMKFTEGDEDVYEKVYLDEGSEQGEKIYSGAEFKIDLEYGDSSDKRKLEIKIPNLYHTVAAVELDADSEESQAYECEGQAFKKDDDEFIQVYVEDDEDEYLND